MAPDVPKTCPSCDAAIGGTAKFCPECGMSFFGPAASLIGSLLSSKYRIVEQIGEGSMGQIYLAEHTGLEKRVAVKILHRDIELGLEASQRFRREGVAAGRIKHKNAIEVYDFDTTEDGLAYLAMEFVEGKNLRELLDEEGRLDFEDAQAIVLQVLAALQAAHELGIVHRDIKPANIMVAADTARPRVKVLDFGLSKLVSRKIDASLTTIPGRIIGTPLYMAPEQSSGEEADARADLYAIALIFYELLVGERPFRGKSLTELLYAQATQPVPLISEECPDGEFPEHLDSFFEKALDRDKDERFQSAEEMSNALLGEFAFEAREDERRHPVEPTRRRGSHGTAAAKSRSNKAPVGLVLGAVGAAIVAGGAFALMSGGEEEDPGNRTTRATSNAVPAGPAIDTAYAEALDEARKALVAEDLDAAEAAVKRAFAERPDEDAEAFLVRGLVKRAQGDDAMALRELRDAVGREPRLDEAIVELSWQEIRTGDIESASERLDAVDEASPFAAEATAARGEIARLSGAAPRAEDLFENALAADEEAWRAHLGLAEIRLAEGAFEDAVNRFIEARRYRGETPAILAGLGEAHLGAGNAGEAIEQLEAARDAGAPPERVERGLAAAYLDDGDTEAAVEILGRVLTADPDDRAANDLMVAASIENEDYEEALAHLEDIDSGAPGGLDRLAMRSELLRKVGRRDDALATAERMIRVARTDPRGHRMKGFALFELGRYQDAETALRETVAIDNRDGRAWLILGVLGMDYLPDGSRALEDLKTAYDIIQNRHPDLGDWIIEMGGG